MRTGRGMQGRLGCRGHWPAGSKAPGQRGPRQAMRGSATQGVLSWALTVEALPICLLTVGPGVPHPRSRYLGWPRGCCRAPCSAVPLAGSSGRGRSSVLGICLPVAPGLKEGGSRQFACLGLWLSFLPSPPPLLFLCWGGCFSPPRAAVAGLHLIASALSQLLAWPQGSRCMGGGRKAEAPLVTPPYPCLLSRGWEPCVPPLPWGSRPGCS